MAISSKSMPRPRSMPLPLACTVPRAAINLDATLLSGQSFCWEQDAAGTWHGWIGDFPCRVESTAQGYAVHTRASVPAIESYFGLPFDLGHALGTFPKDPWLAEAAAFAPGLRLLLQEPWETLASFICSAVKRIPQIAQINRALRAEFGPEVSPGLHAFPSPARLAEAGETALRRCGLGFRARNLHVTACQIAAGEVVLAALHDLPTAEARGELMRLRGVGPKIADCVLLFAYGRHDAFPIDVWVERVLRQLYFKRRRVPAARMRRFVETYFGPHPGYAQQYLFHWVRTARPPAAMEKRAPAAKRRKKAA